MKVKDILKKYTGKIEIFVPRLNRRYKFSSSALVPNYLHNYTVNYTVVKFDSLYVETVIPEAKLTVYEALYYSRDKEETILITLPYKGEESAFLSADIPPEYLSLPISVLIEQEDLNIIILEV